MDEIQILKGELANGSSDLEDEITGIACPPDPY